MKNVDPFVRVLKDLLTLEQNAYNYIMSLFMRKAGRFNISSGIISYKSHWYIVYSLSILFVYRGTNFSRVLLFVAPLLWLLLIVFIHIVNYLQKFFFSMEAGSANKLVNECNVLCAIFFLMLYWCVCQTISSTLVTISLFYIALVNLLISFIELISINTNGMQMIMRSKLKLFGHIW